MEFFYQLSYNWFFFYYFVLGVLLLLQGFHWFLKPGHFVDYLTLSAKNDTRPGFVLKTLRYLFLFSALSLVLSLIPFKIAELLFSLWSLLMLFIIGSMFVQWDQLKDFILNQRDQLRQKIKLGGVTMLALSAVMFMLMYQIYLNSPYT